MPIVQVKIRKRTGMTRSQTFPFSFFASFADISSKPSFASDTPFSSASRSYRRIRPKSNLKMATKNIVKIVRMA